MKQLPAECASHVVDTAAAPVLVVQSRCFNETAICYSLLDRSLVLSLLLCCFSIQVQSRVQDVERGTCLMELLDKPLVLPPLLNCLSNHACRFLNEAAAC